MWYCIIEEHWKEYYCILVIYEKKMGHQIAMILSTKVKNLFSVFNEKYKKCSSVLLVSDRGLSDNNKTDRHFLF